jgi:hypothetical protein
MDMAIATDTNCKHGVDYTGSERCKSCEHERETLDKVGAAFKAISDAINGGYGDAKDMLATFVANQHPTLSGQLAKAVATGIMRRAVYDPDWKNGMQWERDCTVRPVSADNPPHPDHDGRHSCQLVIGSMLAAQQWYV